MKNQIVLAISAIVLSKAGFSQTPKDSTSTKATQADAITLQEIIKKNELSIDLLPLIKFASISEGIFDVKGTVQYKRHLKSNLFLRVGATAMQQRQYREFDNIVVSPAGPVYDAVTYHGTKHKPELHLDAGFEFRWGKRRIRQFAGVDLGYVHKARVYSSYLAYVPRYSNYDPNNYNAVQYNGPDSTALFNNSNTLLTQSYTQTANGIAITPFYGVQYHFSKRFFFSMQLGMPMQFLFIKNISGVNTPAYLQSNNFEFNLGENGILNNFSLGFRF